jgi:hypothetical protein
MVYIRSSSNEGEQETNDEVHNESVVLKVCVFKRSYAVPVFFKRQRHLAK